MSKNKTEICTLEARDLAKLYREKALSPVEVVRALLDAASEKQSHNYFVTITGDIALEAAAQSEKRMMQGGMLSQLDGIPFGAKDVIYVRGFPTTSGCEIYSNFVTEYNATSVDRLLGAGALLMGKLNTHQFAFGPTGDRSCAGPARHPRDPRKITGGSSSASAGAVAAGLLPLSLGTDTGGSIRVPSSFCGVVGMKATHGRTSIYGVKPVCQEMDCVGPLSRKVYDNAAALNILAGYDPKDLFSANVPVCPDYTRRIGQSIKGTVVGVPCAEFLGPLQPGVLAAFKNAVEVLENQGASIREIQFPIDEMAAFRKAHQTILAAGAYTVHERDVAENSALIVPETLDRLLSGKLSACEYIRAAQLRPRAQVVFNELMEAADILMTPMVAVVATDIDAREVEIQDKNYPIGEPFTRFTWFANLTGFPSLSMSCGESEGLPVGVQMFGRAWEEENIYRFAASLEQALA